MENNFPPNRVTRPLATDVFHSLNNQLQILLVSTEKLYTLTSDSQDASSQCAVIQNSARKIAELIGTLAREQNPTHPAPAAIQEWLASFLEREKNREAKV